MSNLLTFDLLIVLFFAGLVPGDLGQSGVNAQLVVVQVFSTRQEFVGDKHPVLAQESSGGFVM